MLFAIVYGWQITLKSSFVNPLQTFAFILRNTSTGHHSTYHHIYWFYLYHIFTINLLYS